MTTHLVTFSLSEEDQKRFIEIFNQWNERGDVNKLSIEIENQTVELPELTIDGMKVVVEFYFPERKEDSHGLERQG